MKKSVQFNNTKIFNKNHIEVSVLFSKFTNIGSYTRTARLREGGGGDHTTIACCVRINNLYTHGYIYIYICVCVYRMCVCTKV